MATKTHIATFPKHGEYIQSVAFSPDGTTLAVGALDLDDNTVKLWNVATETNIANLSGHNHYLTSVAFSPDGTTLASGSADDTVRLWDVATKTHIATLNAQSAVGAVAFSPDGTLLAAGVAEKGVELWDVATKTKITSLAGHPLWVHSVAFSPDGTIIASGSSDDGTVKLWDVSEWKHPLNGELAFGFVGTVEDQAYTAGSTITALQLPEATGGEGEITYRVSDLPADLTFDAATRTISGTPEAATDGVIEVTYTAQDSTGAAATLTFSITVNPPLSFGDLFGLLNGSASEEKASGG